MSNSYTESTYALHLQIPNHPTDEYYFIPFENDNNGSGKAVIIKSTKDFGCLCCLATNLDNPATCSKVTNLYNGMKSFGCKPFQNCASCGFIPNGSNVLNSGVVIKATQVQFN